MVIDELFKNIFLRQHSLPQCLILSKMRVIPRKRQNYKMIFLFEAQIFKLWLLFIILLLALSFKASSWNKMISKCEDVFSLTKLNFKKGFSSFKVEENKAGPKIKTFNWCIYI